MVGLGAAGAGVLDAVSRRGFKALGVDRYSPPHTLGSTHGDSRITRAAYFEDPRYVPLVLESNAAWKVLEQESGEKILTITGGLMIGPENGELVAGARLSGETHNLPFHMLGPKQARSRFPAFAPGKDDVVLYEPEAGLLHPENGLNALLNRAKNHGAEIRTGCKVQRIDGEGARVTLEEGEALEAKKIVLTMGAWLQDFCDLPLTVNRQLVNYFSDPEQQTPKRFLPEAMPIFIWQTGAHYHYGFADLGQGVKLATHHEGEETSAETVNRDIAPEETDTLKAFAQWALPGMPQAAVHSSVCMYTNTPDGHFLLGSSPNNESVILVGGLSGHGFKFAPSLGRLTADLLEGNPSDPAFKLFDPNRFG